MPTTVIRKWGNSQGIRLSKEIMEAMNWNINDEVSIVAQNNKVIIEKIYPRRYLIIDALFANYNGKYLPSKVD